MQGTALPSNPKELKERFSYQFAGEHIGRSFARGWFAVIAQLCVDVDRLLGEDKLEFNWMQIKEKFGTLTMYATMREPANEHEEERRNAVYLAIRGAADKTVGMCIVCGKPSTKEDSPMDYVLQLCPSHGLLYRSGGVHALPQFWLTDSDGADTSA